MISKFRLATTDEEERQLLEQLLTSKRARVPDMEIGLDESGQGVDMPLLNPYYDKPRKPDMQFSEADIDPTASRPEPYAAPEVVTPEVAPETEEYALAEAAARAAKQEETRAADVKSTADSVRAPSVDDMDMEDRGRGLGERDRQLLNMLPDLETLIALGFDLGANKGRGTGQIVSTFAGNKMRQLEQQREGEQRLREIRARKDADPTAMMRAQIMQQNAETARLRALTYGTSVEGTQQRYSDKIDPNSRANQTAIEMRRLGSQASTQGRLDETHARTDEMAGDRAEIARQVKAAQLNTAHELAPQHAADAAAEAAGVKAARNTADTVTPNPEEQRKRAEETARYSIPEGWVERDKNAWKAHNANESESAKTRAYLRSAQAALENADKIIELRKKHGWELMKSADGGNAKWLQNQLIGASSTASNTASVNAGEYPRYAESFGNLDFQAQNDIKDMAYYKVAGVKQDSTLNAMIGARDAMKATFEANARAFGLDPDGLTEVISPSGERQRMNVDPAMRAHLEKKGFRFR